MDILELILSVGAVLLLCVGFFGSLYVLLRPIFGRLDSSSFLGRKSRRFNIALLWLAGVSLSSLAFFILFFVSLVCWAGRLPNWVCSVGDYTVILLLLGPMVALVDTVIIVRTHSTAEKFEEGL